jgi:hypothetical protein
MTISTNGGTSWTSVDSMVVESIAGTGERKLELYDSTGFGDLPAPANMTDTFSVAWWQLYDMPDTLSAFVSSIAFGKVNGQFENHYYLGRLNLRTMVASWSELPFVDVIGSASRAVRPPGIVFITPSVGYAIQTSTTAPPENITTYTMWRTTNAGATWTSTVVPSWIDFASLRFINPLLGVALNAITTDGGTTWKQWAHPFEGGMFYAPDSMHYYVANRWSLFARSEDAGHTWRRNESGAVPRAIASFGGTVVVARNYRSIMTSSDRGETWIDADLDGTMPATASTIWSVAIPDSVGAPRRILGVATLLSYDADTSLAVIASTDGGVTWAVTSTLAGIKAPSGTVLMEFSQEAETQNTGFITAGRRLYTSSDNGVTWSLRDTTLFYQSIESSGARNVVQSNATGIHSSGDAGANWIKRQTLPGARNRAIGLQAFSANEIRALYPDRTQRNLNWNLGASTDGGQTWTLTELTGAPRPLDGYAFWRDMDTVYAVGRGATFQRSGDGGHTFTLLKDSSIEFSALGSWIAAGVDERNIYVAGAGDAIGRWTFAAPPPPLSSPIETGSRLPARIVSVGDGATLELGLARATHVTIDVVDIVGRTALSDAADLDAGLHRIGIALDGLADGTYFLRVSDGASATVIPLRVVH